MKAGLLLLVLTLSIQRLPAQTADTIQRMRFGAFAGLNANFHATSFGSLTGFPSCCPLYTSGSGLTPMLSLFIEIPLSASFAHMIRASLSDMSGQMSAIETMPVIVSQQLVDARIQHTLEAHIRGISIEPLLQFRMTESMGLYTGLRADFALKGTVSLREELIAPEVGTFDNGSRIRNVQGGNIFALEPVVVSAVGGIRVELPLKRDRTVLLMPDLSLAIGLNTVSGSEEWRVHSLRIGASLTFQSPWQRAHIDNTPQTPAIEAEISALPFDGQRELLNQALHIEEFERIEIQPLLPCIFFDHNSDALPARYVSAIDEDPATFDEKLSARRTALSTYYSILPVVGSRLRKNASENVVLTAIIDTTEQRAEEIAARRVRNLAQYFSIVWGVDARRIQTATRPSARSVSGDVAVSAAEHRRVQIDASPAILAPLHRRDTIRTTYPRYLRFRPHTSGNDPVVRWEILLKQRSRLLKNYSGTGEVPFKLNADLHELSAFLSADTLTALLIVNGRSGLAATASFDISTDVIKLTRKAAEKIPDTVVVTTSILNLQGTAQEQIRSEQIAILRSLNFGSPQYTLFDFTDTTAQRARSLAAQFSLNESAIYAQGSESYLFSNTFPENRYYNRCIRIVAGSVR